MGMTTKQILQGVRDWVAGKFYDKTSLDEKLHNEYARQDGAYEEMLVGAAMDLQGEQTITDDAMYQPTGGHNKDVGSGEAEIVGIKGKTVAWNQWLPETSRNYTNVETDTRAARLTVVFYRHGTLLGSTSISSSTGANGAIISAPSGTNYMQVKHSGSQRDLFITPKIKISEGVLAYVYTVISADTSVVGGLQIESFCISNITTIYGAGHEPSSVAQFEQDYFNWFGKTLDYEPYNEGSLMSSKMSSFKSVGFNQFNNGSAKVIGGLQYQITGTYTSITLGSETITPDSNGLFTPSTTGTLTIVGGDASTTCVHLVHSGERDGDYEAYWEETKPIPTTTLKGKLNGEGASVTIFPNGMNKFDSLYTQGGKTYAIVGGETRAYQEGDATSDTMVTDGSTYTYVALAEPIVYEVDDFELPINYKVDDYGTEEVIGAAGSVAPVISAKYSINAPDTIKNLPKNYISVSSMDNFLNRLGSAMGGTWTKTWNEGTNSYDYTFTPNA